MTKVICVVDNSTGFEKKLQTEHGLSFWIETAHGNVLFDTGQTAAVLLHNLNYLGLSVNHLSALVLSHAHFDHTGGIDPVLANNKPLPVYGHTNIFEQRFYRSTDGSRQVGLSVSHEKLLRQRNLCLSEQPKEVVKGLWTTGHIFGRTDQLGSSPFLFIQKDQKWYPDPYTDDLSLVLYTDEGLVVICGCCHAGLLNTLDHVRNNFIGNIHTVIGGIHLVYAKGTYLDHVIDVLKEEFPGTRFLLNHCTGKDAQERFALEFGELVSNFSAGSTVSFGDLA